MIVFKKDMSNFWADVADRIEHLNLDEELDPRDKSIDRGSFVEGYQKCSETFARILKEVSSEYFEEVNES